MPGFQVWGLGLRTGLADLESRVQSSAVGIPGFSAGGFELEVRCYVAGPSAFFQVCQCFGSFLSWRREAKP